jgi:ABC-type glutathione transport system ATPase component
MVFQDAASALDPRGPVARQLAEPLRLHRLVPRARVADRVAELLALVELPAELGRRLPHELSGGQRQRVGIARGLACEPRLLILDEPVSALDVPVRVRLLALLADLRRRLGLTLVVIAHDLGTVARLCDRVAVLYRGELVEEGRRGEVFASPRHPHTRALLAAVPRLGPPRAPTAEDGATADPPDPRSMM